MEWLCNIGLWKEAVDVANAEKNIDALKTISAACSDKHVQLLVAEKLRILQSR